MIASPSSDAGAKWRQISITVAWETRPIIRSFYSGRRVAKSIPSQAFVEATINPRNRIHQGIGLMSHIGN
jgi:hypothetical protein